MCNVDWLVGTGNWGPDQHSSSVGTTLDDYIEHCASYQDCTGVTYFYQDAIDGSHGVCCYYKGEYLSFEQSKPR